jgi:hypothetical protein
MKYLSLFVLMMLFAACDPRAKLSINNPTVEYTYVGPKDNFFPDMRSGPISDTVYLKAIIDDCGEWGGPIDRFALYQDTTGTYKLNCIRHRFNCDSIPFYYSKPKPLEYNKTIILGPAGKQSVADLFTNIMLGKIAEDKLSNYSEFLLHNTDSTLFVKVSGVRYQLEQNYYHFKKEIGLPENNNRAKYQPEYESIEER